MPGRKLGREWSVERLTEATMRELSVFFYFRSFGDFFMTTINLEYAIFRVQRFNPGSHQIKLGALYGRRPS